MKTHIWSTALALAFPLSTIVIAPAISTAFAADKSQMSPASDISPMEKHPECMERTAEAQSPKCLEQDEGVPRHKYPPKSQAQLPTKTPAKPQARLPTKAPVKTQAKAHSAPPADNAKNKSP